MSTTNTEWPLWEVFVRTKAGLDHKHCGSLHAADAAMAVTNLGDLGGGEWEYIEAIIDHDEVIACAVHFGEIQHMEERKAGMRAGRYEVFFKGESGMWK